MSDRMTPKRRRLLGEAAREVDALRAEWRDSLRHHELRMEAQFQELARRLKPKARGRQPKGLPPAKLAEALRDQAAHVRVKSAKGRAKDLRRVEETLREAIAKLPPE